MTPETMRILKLLEDIHASATRILNRLQGQTEESFTNEANADLQDIVARRLTIIGEASASSSGNTLNFVKNTLKSLYVKHGE